VPGIAVLLSFRRLRARGRLVVMPKLSLQGDGISSRRTEMPLSHRCRDMSDFLLLLQLISRALELRRACFLG